MDYPIRFHLGDKSLRCPVFQQVNLNLVKRRFAQNRVVDNPNNLMSLTSLKSQIDTQEAAGASN
jgi:hypothetical protein